MASAGEVEAKLGALIARLEESDAAVRASLSDTISEPRVLSVHVEDLGRDWWTELVAGRMAGLREGEPEEADVRIRVGSDDLVALIDGEIGLVTAYLTGRIRIEASAGDLMQLRKML